MCFNAEIRLKGIGRGQPGVMASRFLQLSPSFPGRRPNSSSAFRVPAFTDRQFMGRRSWNNAGCNRYLVAQRAQRRAGEETTRGFGRRPQHRQLSAPRGTREPNLGVQGKVPCAVAFLRVLRVLRVSVVNDNGHDRTKPKIPMTFPGCFHGKEKD
jgi:hypothetical protein